MAITRRDEVLDVVGSDTQAIPRYDLVDGTGQTIGTNVSLTLKNNILQEGTKYNKDYMDEVLAATGTTTGTATALLLAQENFVYKEGVKVRFRLHINLPVGAITTLNVNGTGAYRLMSSDTLATGLPQMVANYVCEAVAVIISGVSYWRVLGAQQNATKLAVSRNISATGAVTGSVSFDGSADVTGYYKPKMSPIGSGGAGESNYWVKAASIAPYTTGQWLNYDTNVRLILQHAYNSATYPTASSRSITLDIGLRWGTNVVTHPSTITVSENSFSTSIFDPRNSVVITHSNVAKDRAYLWIKVPAIEYSVLNCTVISEAYRTPVYSNNRDGDIIMWEEPLINAGTTTPTDAVVIKPLNVIDSVGANLIEPVTITSTGVANGSYEFDGSGDVTAYYKGLQTVCGGIGTSGYWVRLAQIRPGVASYMLQNASVRLDFDAISSSVSPGSATLVIDVRWDTNSIGAATRTYIRVPENTIATDTFDPTTDIRLLHSGATNEPWYLWVRMQRQAMTYRVSVQSQSSGNDNVEGNRAQDVIVWMEPTTSTGNTAPTATTVITPPRRTDAVANSLLTTTAIQGVGDVTSSFTFDGSDNIQYFNLRKSKVLGTAQGEGTGQYWVEAMITNWIVTGGNDMQGMSFTISNSYAGSPINAAQEAHFAVAVRGGTAVVPGTIRLTVVYNTFNPEYWNPLNSVVMLHDGTAGAKPRLMVRMPLQSSSGLVLTVTDEWYRPVANNSRKAELFTWSPNINVNAGTTTPTDAVVIKPVLSTPQYFSSGAVGAAAGYWNYAPPVFSNTDGYHGSCHISLSLRAGSTYGRNWSNLNIRFYNDSNLTAVTGTTNFTFDLTGMPNLAQRAQLAPQAWNAGTFTSPINFTTYLSQGTYRFNEIRMWPVSSVTIEGNGENLREYLMGITAIRVQILGTSTRAYNANEPHKGGWAGQAENIVVPYPTWGGAAYALGMM